LDISSCNGDPSFESIKAAGIEGVYHRATLGTTPDAAFQRHRAAARAAGLRWGSYGVLVPGANVLAQALAFIAAVGAVEPTDLPCFIDFESAGDRPDDAESWCVHVEQALQRQVGLYSYRSYLAALSISAEHPLRKRWLWLADYEGAPHSPPGWPEPKLWQAFGDVGVASVAVAFGATGIAGARADGSGVHIDRDFYNGNAEDLVAWIASTSLAQMPPPQGWHPDTIPATPIRAEEDPSGMNGSET
jgi:lysozyme